MCSEAACWPVPNGLYSVPCAQDLARCDAAIHMLETNQAYMIAYMPTFYVVWAQSDDVERTLAVGVLNN